ncbi:hypothetical protein ACHAQE_010614 [Botrytis cinerea]
MASNVNNGSDQMERRVTRSRQAPTIRSQNDNRRNRSQVAAAVNDGEDETPAPRSRASRSAPRSQRDNRDAFTRIIAPALQIDRCKVELESAGQELIKKVQDLNLEEGFDFAAEVRNREKGIGNGKKILEASQKAVDWIESQIKSRDLMTEQTQEKMKRYKQILSTISVDVQVSLDRLLVERQGQVTDLTRKNEELLKQVGMLTGRITDLTMNSSTTTSIECDELKEFLQENLSALKVQNKENVETEAISNLRKQYEQLLHRNEEISKEKGRVDGELIHSREESKRLRSENDILSRKNEELKNAALASENLIQQLREQLSQPIFHPPLTINTFVPGQSHVVQQSPKPPGFIAPQSPCGEFALLQQSPSSTTSSLQSIPSHGFSGPPPSAWPFDEYYSPQLPMHSPACGPPESAGHAFNSGSPPTLGNRTSMQLPAHHSPPHTPGINQPPRFEHLNPTILQGPFGKFRINLPPAPANIVPPSYKFLVSGGIEGGVTTTNVPPVLNQKMMDQITEWLKSVKGTNWFQITLMSRTRCVEVRVKNVSNARAPSSSDVGDKFACKHCINRHLLCVLIGSDGPVIAPLAHGYRLPDATPKTPGYYIT